LRNWNKLRGEFPDALLDQAIEALQQGDTEEADRLFQEIEDEGEGHLKRIAEAAFQRGKIAEDAIRYTEALEYLEKAVRLQPDNALYLNEAGLLYLTLANHKKAIEYFELALASDLKTYGEDHPHVATKRNNLGLAWNALGEHHKAIAYYEQALPVFEKFLGKDHPNTKIVQDNLDKARVALNESP